jgi:three-Cys-motif partner protein
MFNLEPPQDDGLCIPEVGEWSKDKHYFLQRYIDAFTNSMKNKKWSSLHYIDLFAGAGIERLKDSRKLEWGSPLIAAQAPHSFSSLHICEKDPEKFQSLSVRLQRYSNIQLLQGDANEKISEIICQIPSRSLTLAFLDPYGLHLNFDTIKQLSSRRADLILFFPDRLDMVRNWQAYYFRDNESNLDKFLGEGVDWRTTLMNTARNRYADELLKLYETQLCGLGYRPFDPKRISVKGRPLYRLLFCCKDVTGLKLWHNISLKEPDGQRTFDF